jgi:hypothetical protein
MRDCIAHNLALALGLLLPAPFALDVQTSRQGEAEASKQSPVINLGVL